MNKRFWNRLFGERELHQLVAVIVERFKQPLAPQLGFAGKVFIRDVFSNDLVALLPFGKGEHLHPHKIDDAAERLVCVRRPLANRNLQRNRMGAKPIANFLVYRLEVGAFAIHLVDERKPRNFIFVRLPPTFRLRFDTFAALKTTTPPSSTRRLRSTSAVKSTWPGVSIRLIVTSFHGNCTHAE